MSDDGDDLDETIVVGPPAPTDDEPDDATVVVAPPVAAAPDEADEADESTVVVARSGVEAAPDDLDDRTVVVERPPAEVEDLESTVVVPRPLGGQTHSQRPPEPEALRRPRPRAANRAKRTRIVLPEDQTPSQRAAVGAGAGTVSAYQPRQIPPPPTGPLAAPDGQEATRRDAPGMPSVNRASRRAAVTLVLVTAAACLVSIAGLVLIARLVFGL